jgi:alginate O-acetyltransferase complex protein AlgJ
VSGRSLPVATVERAEVEDREVAPPLLAPPPLPAPPPRGHRRRRATILVAVAAIVFFFGPGVAYLGGARAKDIENRRLTSFPSISQGWSALPQLGQWAIDHLPGRQLAVDADDTVTRSVFRDYPSYGTTGPGPVAYPYVLSGKHGWLYFGDDVANKCHPRMGVTQTLARMRRLANIVAKSGRRFLLVVVPDKTTSYPQALPPTYPGKACSTAWTDKFWTNLRATPGLNLVDVLAPLEQAQQATGQPMSRPHDSHFSPLGASIYAQTLAAALDSHLATGTTATPGPFVDEQGDLSVLTGHTTTDHVQSYPVVRAGVTQQPGSQPELRYTRTHVVNKTTSAPLYQDPTIMLGDSFTASSLPDLVPYFTSLDLLHSEASILHPQAVASWMISRGTVIYEIVERSASTGRAGLLTIASLNAIAKTLAAHPYQR